MKTICYYEASDGTKFDDDIECVEYELKQKFYNTKTLRLQDFDEVQIVDLENNLDRKTEIIIINDNAAKELVQEINKFYGYNFPTEVGGYWLSNEGDIWLNYDEVDNLYHIYKSVRDDIAQYL